MCGMCSQLTYTWTKDMLIFCSKLIQTQSFKSNKLYSNKLYSKRNVNYQIL